MNFAEWILEIAPPWLLGDNGKTFLRSIGTFTDVHLDGLRQAVRARFVRLAPVDALSKVGWERLLERAPSESDNAYRTRLASAWDLHQLDGTVAGIKEMFRPLGVDPSGVRVLDERSTLGANERLFSSRFWIVVDNGYHPWTAAPSWDVPGAAWADPEPVRTWDSTATVDELAFMRREIRRVKDAHGFPVEVVVVLVPRVWSSSGTWDPVGVQWDLDEAAGTALHWIVGHTWGEEERHGGAPFRWDGLPWTEVFVS